MTHTTIPDPKRIISPKFWAGLITSLGIAALGSILAALTPETFAGLGAWGPIAFSAVTLIGGQLAVYLKSDPLRANAVVAVTAPVVPVSDEPVVVD